ncbi:MAG: hypothetical protein Q9221_004786 [Calogaya cf. arnoldii]
MADDPGMPTPEEVHAIKEFIDGQTTADAAAKRCTCRISLEEMNPDPTSASVNALSARLTTKFLQAFRSYAVETIEDPLNKKNPKESCTREFFLPAATYQIIFGSYPLWNLRNDSEVKKYMDAVLEWNRWREAFEKPAENAEISTETRAILRQAVTAMETVAQDPEKR